MFQTGILNGVERGHQAPHAQHIVFKKDRHCLWMVRKDLGDKDVFVYQWHAVLNLKS